MSTCRVCGFPIDQHTVELRGGVAHAVYSADDGTLIVRCSLEYAERERLSGEIDRLRTIVRSLRNRAGRAYTKQQWSKGVTLGEYADFVAAERDRLIEIEARWYAW